METKEQYHAPPECPQNGHSRPSDAPEPIREWFEADRISVSLILARRRGTEERSVKIGELAFLGAERQPILLFPDGDDTLHPWGTALENFIAQAIAQATAQQVQQERER